MFKDIKKHFIIALQFLTILPVKIKAEIKDKDFGKALLYFPAAGLVIGLILAAIAYIFSYLPAFLTAAVVLSSSIILTGGLHLDGFADTCDGFYASSSKEQTLKIMRDSRIGTMGVIGIFCVLLLKFAVFSSFSPLMLQKAALTAAVFSRWAVSFACCLSGYARPEGKAKFFIEHADKKRVLTGGLAALFFLLALMRLKGLVIFILALVPVFLLVRYSEKKIGGLTGDVLGAISETAEISVFLLSAVL